MNLALHRSEQLLADPGELGQVLVWDALEQFLLSGDHLWVHLLKERQAFLRDPRKDHPAVLIR
ncbi:MAG TPA: hypothetical protein VFH43_08265, partial [Candidatus Kapabacteria bacterium]|nr:hypothetical protein [Candidatus Kapabacteria bacterium]